MYHGDLVLGDTIDVKFTTTSSTGAPTTLAGTPVVSAYPGNSVTQLTAGITLTVDFDGVTGLHNVRVVASSGNGYATATNYVLVITTGTVGGISVVGYCVGSFSIGARSVVLATGGIAVTAFAAGAIDAAAIAANALGASELAQDAAQEVADELLNRDLAGGASGNTRGVRNALRTLRNKVAEAAGTATVYEEDDATAAWTAAVTRTAATNAITTVDPA